LCFFGFAANVVFAIPVTITIAVNNAKMEFFMISMRLIDSLFFIF